MAIEDFIFPTQSLTTKAAGKGVLGMGPMGMLGGGMDQSQMLLGLLAPMLMGGQQGGGGEDAYADMSPEEFLTGGQGANQFAGQTPGAPGMQNRGSQQMDPLSLLDQNINRRFGM